MRAIFFLLTLVVPMVGSSSDEVSPPEAELSLLEQGQQALKKQKGSEAAKLLKACAAAAPAGSALLIDCRWELGWAYWVLGRWELVVGEWEFVKNKDPQRASINESLAKARDQLKLEKMVSGPAPAETFVSKAPEGASVRIRAVGDMMIGRIGRLPAHDGKLAFADVQDWLRDADITFGNLEGPICNGGKTAKCRPGQPANRCYAFRSPSHYVNYYVEAGFDMLSTANNHANDFGQHCRLKTEQHLEKAGIAHSGRPGTVAERTVNGLKVMMIGFHTSPHSHHLNNHAVAEKLVRKLAAECDVLIVSFHGGAEGRDAIHVPKGREKFLGEDRGDLRAFTHLMIDAGADLILGHGPHVLRGMEVYKGRLIAYSLGNFATSGFNVSGNLGLGVIAEATLDKDGKLLSGKLFPTRQTQSGIALKDPKAKALDQIRFLSKEDFPDRHILLAKDGSLMPPAAE